MVRSKIKTVRKVRLNFLCKPTYRRDNKTNPRNRFGTLKKFISNRINIKISIWLK